MPDRSEQTAAEIVRLVGDALSHQPLPTFADQYRHAISETDPDVIKTINLSEEDFAFIKDVRDDIAHGDELGVDDHKFANIGTVISRIILLLNEQHLAKVLGTAEFFELSEESWPAMADAARAFMPCFLEGPPGTIAFSGYSPNAFELQSWANNVTKTCFQGFSTLQKRHFVAFHMPI
ncbi:hypothetical protein A9P79_01230 [Cupriavidus taiwanensis]|nr:hypothetical protein A9P79_01230 [Cupriavidus taiwanensis]